jgi:hypothetical protein
MAEYRLLADAWVRIDPETIDDKRPRSRWLKKGDLVPKVTDEEVEYLTGGARPSLVEADSDEDPFRDDHSVSHVVADEANGVKATQGKSSTPPSSAAAK